MRRRWRAAFVLFGIVLVIAQADTQPAESQYPREPADEQYFDVTRYDEDWMTDDRNEDGVIDYAIRITEEMKKDREAVDFNFDGMMDDFYFYSNEVLQRQEVDTNFDGSIDLWVFLTEGVYIERYEQDTDFDGLPDVVKDYGEEKPKDAESARKQSR